MVDMSSIIHELKEKLRDNIGDDIYDEKFQELKYSLNEEELTLKVYTPDEVNKQWLMDNRFDRRILKIVKYLTQKKYELYIMLSNLNNTTEKTIVNDSKKTTENNISYKNSSNDDYRKSGFETHSLNPENTFDTYITGDSNELAFYSTKSVAENPGEASFNPLFIYGGVGLGKTHLLHAIGNELKITKPNMTILNLTSEEFKNEYVQAVNKKRLQQLVNKFRKNCDILLIDDIQFLSKWKGSEAQFFHIFNHLIDAEKQIVMTSDRYPNEIPDIEDRLRTRFEWGLIVAIEPPNLNTRIDIIKDKAKRYGIKISDEVVDFLAVNLKSNIREIEGILRKLKLYSLTKKKISIDTVEDILRKHNKLNQKQLSIDVIKKKVSNFYDIPVEDLVSKKRQKAITTARQIAMYIAKKITKETLENIGKGFGRDHSTVVNSINKVTKLIKEDIKISKDVKELMRLLTE